jgi:hypothetical protein
VKTLPGRSHPQIPTIGFVGCRYACGGDSVACTSLLLAALEVAALAACNV